MDESQNAFQMDVTMFTKSLDQMEKYLFSLGQEVYTDDHVVIKL